MSTATASLSSRMPLSPASTSVIAASAASSSSANAAAATAAAIALVDHNASSAAAAALATPISRREDHHGVPPGREQPSPLAQFFSAFVPSSSSPSFDNDADADSYAAADSTTFSNSSAPSSSSSSSTTVRRGGRHARQESRDDYFDAHEDVEDQYQEEEEEEEGNPSSQSPHEISQEGAFHHQPQQHQYHYQQEYDDNDDIPLLSDEGDGIVMIEDDDDDHRFWLQRQKHHEEQQEEDQRQRMQREQQEERIIPIPNLDHHQSQQQQPLRCEASSRSPPSSPSSSFPNLEQETDETVRREEDTAKVGSTLDPTAAPFVPNEENQEQHRHRNRRDTATLTLTQKQEEQQQNKVESVVVKDDYHQSLFALDQMIDGLIPQHLQDEREALADLLMKNQKQQQHVRKSFSSGDLGVGTTPSYPQNNRNGSSSTSLVRSNSMFGSLFMPQHQQQQEESTHSSSESSKDPKMMVRSSSFFGGLPKWTRPSFWGSNCSSRNIGGSKHKRCQSDILTYSSTSTPPSSPQSVQSLLLTPKSSNRRACKIRARKASQESPNTSMDADNNCYENSHHCPSLVLAPIQLQACFDTVAASGNNGNGTTTNSSFPLLTPRGRSSSSDLDLVGPSSAPASPSFNDDTEGENQHHQQQPCSPSVAAAASTNSGGGGSATKKSASCPQLVDNSSTHNRGSSNNGNGNGGENVDIVNSAEIEAIRLRRKKAQMLRREQRSKLTVVQRSLTLAQSLNYKGLDFAGRATKAGLQLEKQMVSSASARDEQLQNSNGVGDGDDDSIGNRMMIGTTTTHNGDKNTGDDHNHHNENNFIDDEEEEEEENEHFLWSNALDCWDNSLEIYTSLLGKYHVRVADIQNNRGIALGKLRQYIMAVQALDHALLVHTKRRIRIVNNDERNKTKKNDSSSSNDDTAIIGSIVSTLHNKANVYRDAKDQAEALRTLAEAQSILINSIFKEVDHNSNETIRIENVKSYQLLARVLTAMGHIYYESTGENGCWLRESREYYQEALQVYQKLLLSSMNQNQDHHNDDESNQSEEEIRVQWQRQRQQQHQLQQYLKHEIRLLQYDIKELDKCQQIYARGNRTRLLYQHRKQQQQQQQQQQKRRSSNASSMSSSSSSSSLSQKKKRQQQQLNPRRSSVSSSMTSNERRRSVTNNNSNVTHNCYNGDGRLNHHHNHHQQQRQRQKQPQQTTLFDIVRSLRA